MQDRSFTSFSPDSVRSAADIWSGSGFGRGISVAFGFLGGATLILYGVIPTLQPAHFGRVYAAYGGIFVVLALLWGWQVDDIVPDRFDLIYL